MTLEVLTDAVIDALLVSGNPKILAELMKDGSADNIERLALTLPNGPLQLGLMHYGDVIRLYSLSTLLSRQGSRDAESVDSYRTHLALGCLKQVPAKPVYKEPTLPTRNEGEDLFDWLWRCPLVSWVNFVLKRDIPSYQKRNPVWWVDRVKVPSWVGGGYMIQRILGSTPEHEPGHVGGYVRIYERVFAAAVTEGLMVLCPEKKYSETIDTYVLAEKYRVAAPT